MSAHRVRRGLFIAVIVLFATAPAGADEFATIEQVARDYFLELHPGRQADVKSVYLGSTEGGLNNTLGYQSTANATIRLKGGKVSRIQLYQKSGRWVARRELPKDSLPEAHALLIDEIEDEQWRETKRLEQRVAAGLEARLQREKKMSQVEYSSPRCFVALRFRKALCDIWYTTWTSDEPECFDRAVLFELRAEGWMQMPGNYHPGHRINPDNGLVFEIEPREACKKSKR